MGEREQERLESVYESRSYDSDPAYRDTEPSYLQRVQGLERQILGALSVAGFDRDLASLEILDYGCGNGLWMGRWLAWGANYRRLHGVDIRPSAIDYARTVIPAVDFQSFDGSTLPFADDSFDVVSLNLVFSSILSARIRRACAVEIQRVTRPGGLILWYDFVIDNPKNPDVRGISAKRARNLWAPLRPIAERHLTLAPPLARRVAPRSAFAAAAIESLLPPVRTHYFAAFQKPAIT